MKNKKGFTLIELLAVVIILGILLVIAVPAVSQYIEDSRKTSYVNIAKSLGGGARNLVNSAKFDLTDTNTTYYIDGKCINTENDYRSPYGDFVKAYVVVTTDGQSYNYYWTSVDSSGIGVSSIINLDKIKINNLETGINSSDITTNRGLNNRKYIVVINENCEVGVPTENTGPNINGNTGEEIELIAYPSGKDKTTVVTGDLVKIGEEEFYVVKRSGDDLYLLTHYNLNVGSDRKTDVPEGIQNSEVKSYINWAEPVYGAVAFSNTNYWDGKVGTNYTGIYCNSETYSPGVTCADVYDSNSELYQYVENYKSYLEGLGATIKEARLLKYEELRGIGWDGNSFWDNGPLWIQETSFWLGSASDSSNIWRIRTRATFYFSYYSSNTYHGVRPVIVI